MSNKLTSRERVLASINHREPDRVPVDLGATPSSGISTIAYYNLKQHLGHHRGPHAGLRRGAAARAAGGVHPRPLRDRRGGCGPDVQHAGRGLVRHRPAARPGHRREGHHRAVPGLVPPCAARGRELGRVQQRRDAGGHDADRRDLLRRDLHPLSGRLPGRLSRSAGRDGQDPLVGAGAQPVGQRGTARFLGAVCAPTPLRCGRAPTGRS